MRIETAAFKLEKHQYNLTEKIVLPCDENNPGKRKQEKLNGKYRKYLLANGEVNTHLISYFSHLTHERALNLKKNDKYCSHRFLGHLQNKYFV